jgi:two-component system, cell cycle sensor histidine kinase and response regulator CckA
MSGATSGAGFKSRPLAVSSLGGDIAVRSGGCEGIVAMQTMNGQDGLSGAELRAELAACHARIRELSAVELLFNELSENSPNMVFINQFGRIIYVNRRCSELMGYTREEFLSPDFDFVRVIAPESRKTVEEAYARHRSGEEVQSYELVAVTKDGGRVDTILSTWLGEANGKPAIFGVQTDITERRRIERELKTSEERYRALVDALPDAIVVAELDGNVLMANEAAARLYGHSDVAAFMRTSPNLVDGIALPQRLRAKELGKRAVDSGHLVTGEFDICRKDGVVVPTELTVVPLLDGQGGAVTVIGVARDLTERRAVAIERQRLESQVHHAQRLDSLGVLAGGIAHDFNNLLVGVLGNAGLALMDLPAEAPARVAVQQIELAARRAAGLTHQMLAYSGRGSLIREPILLGNLVGEMVQLLEAAIPKSVSIAFEVVSDPPAFEGDAAQMQQVVMNLITNAAEAMGGRSGVISIQVGFADGRSLELDEFVVGAPLGPGTYAYLTVCDEGIGMDPSTRDRMFEPFFTTKFTGRGLGLAAVLGIVRGHRGTLTVKTGLGKGSCFRVLIPAPGGQVRVPTRSPDSESSIEPCSDHALILVVDDEEVVRALAAQALERAGFATLLARDGREAVDLIRERGKEVAAVVLDLTMPNLGGAEAFRQIREMRSDLPVILSSGYLAAEATERFSTLGFFGFVQKPYLPQDLVRTVQEAVAAAPVSA